MAIISLHNVTSIKVEQEVTTTEGIGTYDVIKLIVNTKDGREEVTIFGANDVSLPGIILKEDFDDGTE